MVIQIVPTTIDGFDGLDNMFRLEAADDEGNIGLDILTTVTADEWPEISDAILRGLMLMCPGSGVKSGQANTKTFDPLFKVGDTIYEKVMGDRWQGIVVGVFNTMQGEARIVVECMAPDVKGDLHIYNPDQLIVTARKR